MEFGRIVPFWGATALYGVSLGMYAHWFRAGAPTAGRRASLSLWIAALAHLGGMAVLGLSRGFGPPTGLGESLSLISLSTVLIYLYLESRVQERGLGPFALVLVLLLMVKASLIGPAVRVEQLLKDHLFGPHATSIILAMSGFTISAFLSIAYLALYRQLRDKKPGVLMRRLPSLQALDLMTRRATRLGLVALTIGLVTGSLLAHSAWGEYWSWDPKQCMTLLTWMLYAAALYLRRSRDWQGERIAAVNLFAFASVVAGVILMYTVFPTAHSFGVDAS